LNQPVAIRELKRFAIEHCGEEPFKQMQASKPPTGKKVSIIGSGPAGLTAAYYLRKQGHSVTVFEALPLAGGMLRYGIPAYRLPRNVLEAEIRLVKRIGVEVKTGARIDSIDKLFEQGFDAVLVAIGTQQGQKLPILGASNPSVLIGLDFLREVNSGLRTDIGQKVVVLGGGSVAFDCARVARRLGAGQVQIACLEAKDKMLAAAEEIVEAEEEGIQVHPATTFAAILTDQGIISGVECFAVESFTFDEDNRTQIEIRPNSRFVLAADQVIFAIGQRPDVPANFGLNLTDKGLVEIDPFTLNTNREGVFAAGDAVTGTASVIQAIAAGRKTAILIDRFLGGDGNIDEKPGPAADTKNNLGLRQGFAGLNRNAGFHISPEQRTQTFCPVECSLSESTALAESGRCLQCDLRLKIRPVKFWSEYG
jgi:NADPH-dependent glutamate synthase beta subunit-like oxidoreductase